MTQAVYFTRAIIVASEDSHRLLTQNSQCHVWGIFYELLAIEVPKAPQRILDIVTADGKNEGTQVGMWLSLPGGPESGRADSELLICHMVSRARE